MQFVIVLLALIAMAAALLLFLPFSYDLVVDIQKPFHLRASCSFMGHGFFYEWDYVFGKKPRTTCFMGWKAAPKPAAAAAVAAPTQAGEEADDTFSEEELRQAIAEEPEAEEASSDFFWWKDYILSEDFLTAFFALIWRLLHHSRIRTLELHGSLGLPAPHQTGMLAGFLYMILPEATQGLAFDFLEEHYDCHARIAGRIYPGALLLYAAAFIVSRPVRRLLLAVRQHRKEHAHG